MVYDSNYSLVLVIMLLETIVSINWELVSSVPQACWLPDDLHQETVDVFSQSWRIRAANQSPDQFRNVSALPAAPPLCPLPTWESAEQQTSQLLHDVYEGYWSSSCSSPGRLPAVGVAAAVDTVPLGTPSEFGFVDPA